MDNEMSDNKRPLTPEFLRLLRNSLNKDYLQSYNGFLRIAQLVTLVTSFAALAQYNMMVSSTNLIYYLFMTTTIVICLLNLVLFCVSIFSLDKKKIIAPITSKKLMIAFSAFAGHLLLALSSLLAMEAAQVQRNTHRSDYEKCNPCSKINIAVVFGFLTWILFTVELIHNLLQCRCGKTKISRVDVQEFQASDEITQRSFTCK